MFVNFSSPVLQDLFRPPDVKTRNALEYTHPVALATLICLGCPTALLIACLGIKTLCPSSAAEDTEVEWKPWPISWPYLFFISSISVALLALVAVLYQQSQQPDPDPTRKYLP